MPRPVCALCGSPHGRKSVQLVKLLVEFEAGVPPYIGNGVVLAEEVWPALGADPAREFVALDPWGAADHAIIAAEAVGVRRVTLDATSRSHYSGRRGRAVTRRIWDGESYVGRYGNFCSQRCGVAFGQAAYDAGYRVAAATDDEVPPPKNGAGPNLKG